MSRKSSQSHEQSAPTGSRRPRRSPSLLLLGCAVGMAVGVVPPKAYAQDEPVEERVDEPTPEEMVPLGPVGTDLPSVEPLDPETVLDLDEARELLLETGQMKLADNALEKADLVELRTFSVWYPSVNLEASYTLHDEEVEFAQPNPYAPLLPYLESVYANDPALQQQLDDNPELPDARELAQAEPQPVVVQNRHDFSAGLTVRQSLFDYRIFPGSDIADASVRRAELGQEEVIFELERSLLRLYFNAVAAKRRIGVSERNVALAQLNNDRAIKELEAGVGLKFETNRTGVALRKAERELETAKLNYALAIEGLATLLEIPPDFDVITPPERHARDDVDLMVHSALEGRATLDGLEVDQELASYRIDELDSRSYPKLYALGQAFLQRENAFAGDFFRWQIVVGMTWQIYDSGYNAIEAQEYEVDIARAAIEKSNQEKQIEAEIRQSWLRIEAAQRTVASASDEVELARENVDLTAKARDLGAATPLDLEAAQQQLFLGELALANAEIQLQAEVYLLRHLSGAK